RIGGGPPPCAAHPRQQLRCAERLGHVVVSAFVERAHFHLFLTVRRQHHHRQPAPFAQSPTHLHSVEIRQHQVENHQVERLDHQRIQRTFPRSDLRYLIAVGTQHKPQCPPDLRLVIHHQYPRLVHTAPVRLGSVKTNRAPVTGPSSSHNLPPWASTKPRAIVSPRPEPGARV